MKLKVRHEMDGPGPSDVIVSFATDAGRREEVVVYRGAVENGALEIGPVLGQKDDAALIELPRETAGGQWRVWVPAGEILKEYA